MPVQFQGTLKIFVKKSFTSKDGETVSYNEAYFVGEDELGNDTVCKVNTKLDLTEKIEMFGSANMQVQKDGKLRLISFTKL